eukprot:2724335-Pleurochrysis_carterae.AAC.3
MSFRSSCITDKTAPSLHGNSHRGYQRASSVVKKWKPSEKTTMKTTLQRGALMMKKALLLFLVERHCSFKTACQPYAINLRRSSDCRRVSLFAARTR